MASEQLQTIMADLMSLTADWFAALYPEPDVGRLRVIVRRNFARSAAPASVTCTPCDAGGVRAEWVCDADGDPDRRLLYLHGGGYFCGDIDCYRPFAGQLAKATGCAVLNVEYGLRPEHPFVQARDDALTAFRWMRAHGPKGTAPARRTFIGGDSAGGGITLTSTYALRENGEALPDALVPLCPAVDMSRLALLPANHCEMLAATNRWVLDGVDPRDPLASPIYGELAELPPLFMQAGGAEPGVIETVRFEERARFAGVDVQLEIWPEMPHVWQLYAPFVPEAVDAIERIGRFVRSFR
jgi:acetyl esterase/lipase